MNEQDALLEAIFAHPEEDTARLFAADPPKVDPKADRAKTERMLEHPV